MKDALNHSATRRKHFGANDREGFEPSRTHVLSFYLIISLIAVMIPNLFKTGGLGGTRTLTPYGASV